MMILINYLKIAIRNLINNRTSAFINVGGLAIGMAVATLIGLWIWDELSFNQYHDHYDSITLVKRKGHNRGEIFISDYQVSALGDHLRTTYGNHFERVTMIRRPEEYILSAGEKAFTQIGQFMEPEGPEMLSLRMLAGSRKGLEGVNSILLSESVATKLFPLQDPIGESVRINNNTVVQVTGIYEDLPHNSQFRQATFISPLSLFFSMTDQDANAWTNQNMLIYTQLQPGTDLAEINALIKDDYAVNAGRDDLENPPELFLLPMRKWHLYSEFENGQPVASANLKFIWFNGIIGLFVLFLACINFMNLSTARSEKRAKEVGIRKTIGSRRIHLIHQFFSESILISFLSFSGALALVQLTLPWFNKVSDKQLSILWSSPWFWFAGISFALLTGLLAGSYPALYLSSFKPIRALKGAVRPGSFNTAPRKVLVVFQFVISISLMIGTLIVHRQLQHAKDRPVGYSRSGLLMLPKRVAEFYGKEELLISELKKTGVVAEVGQSNYPLTNTRGNNGGFGWAGKDPTFNPTFNTIRVSHDYGAAIGWELMEGRDFSREFGTDKTGVVINESALKLMNLEQPIGAPISFDEDYFGSNEFKILGVVKDMIKGSPYDEAFPAIMFLSDKQLYWLFIRIDPSVSANKALPKIEAAIKNLIPSAPFDYKFVDEEYAAKFQAEERLSSLATIFAVLAILISCLGLFGLAIYVAEQRTKEIGIRKILGASVTTIIGSLSADFLKLVIIAILIAIPLAWYVSGQWLENYNYRIEIHWSLFAAAALLSIVIAFLTIGFQSLRAALANPIESLRNE